jgi:hypothetical protein
LNLGQRMAWDKLVKVFQITAAALGVPAAAAGSYSAYQTYFSPEVACAKLRSTILETMEKKVGPDAKRSLLRKDVTAFLKDCGEGDPDTRSIFQAAITEPAHPARPAGAVASATPRDGANPQAVAAVSPQPHPVRTEIFGSSSPDEHGWVALGRREANAWTANFTGTGVSETTLPSPGTILTAQRIVPVWSEPQGTTNDPAKLQSRLRASSCVRVLGTRTGGNRKWAEVVPAACS